MVKCERSPVRCRVAWAPEDDEIVNDDAERERNKLVVEAERGDESGEKLILLKTCSEITHGMKNRLSQSKSVSYP